MREEGTGPMRRGRYFPYEDTVGKLTIGWGFNIEDVGISADTVEHMWRERRDEVLNDLRGFYWFQDLDVPRQRAVFDMRYILGPAKFRMFKRFLAAMLRHDYTAAAASLRASRMARQIPARVERMARALAPAITIDLKG